MSLARINNWKDGDILKAADLLAEFNNIYNNPGDYCNGMTIGEATIGTVTGNLIGNVTGSVVDLTTSTTAHKVTAKTDNYVLTAANCNGLQTFTNEGAEAEITFTLPTAVAGLKVTIITQNAVVVNVAPGEDDTIRLRADEASINIKSNAIGAVCVLTAINATEWVGDYSNFEVVL